MTPAQLQESIYKTYVCLRIGLCVLAFAFPFLLRAIGRWNGIDLQNSISHYYCIFRLPNHPELPGRIVFVGVLFVLGFFLILYRGFTTVENWVLNMAGACALIVALCPMPIPEGCTDCASNPYSFMHYPAAITLFVCLAYVAAFCTKQTLKYLPGGSKRQRRFQIGYYVIAAIMIISPIAITVIRNFNIYQKSPFILETIGVVMFAIYWGLKSYELYESGIEKKAMGME